MASMIRAYRTAPKELFRVNNGYSVRARPWAPGLTSYDIHVDESGSVLPKALEPSTYRAPNGASMRPNSPYQHRLLNMFRGGDALVFIMKQGTPLPDELILVHERTDHWSLQPAVKMDIAVLNETLTAFFRTTCTSITIPDWYRRYPKPTDFVRQRFSRDEASR